MKIDLLRAMKLRESKIKCSVGKRCNFPLMCFWLFFFVIDLQYRQAIGIQHTTVACTTLFFSGACFVSSIMHYFDEKLITINFHLIFRC